jgi:hypothetical protein
VPVFKLGGRFAMKGAYKKRPEAQSKDKGVGRNFEQ